MRRTACCLTFILVCCVLGCEGSPSVLPYASATLTHAGFDFSTGAVPPDWTTSDGHTTNWASDPAINAEKSYGPYVWFAPFANTATENFTKDMGEVTLASVTTVPTTWDAGAAQTLEPLIVGHVYVVKCLDGYAKFLVKAITPAQEFEWPVEVDYAYTSTTTFSQ